MGRVVPGGQCAEAALREVVGSREGIILGLGAACARISCCTRLCWPWLAMERPCEASGERDSYGIIQLWILLGPKHMILMAIHVVRVCLYVKLTSYPLSHDSRGSIGWVGHSEIGPLNFACGGMTVTGLYLDCAGRNRGHTPARAVVLM